MARPRKLTVEDLTGKNPTPRQKVLGEALLDAHTIYNKSFSGTREPTAEYTKTITSLTDALERSHDAQKFNEVMTGIRRKVGEILKQKGLVEHNDYDELMSFLKELERD